MTVVSLVERATGELRGRQLGGLPVTLGHIRSHGVRHLMGGDTFFLSSSVNPENAVVSLGKGNEPRLKAAKVALSRLPADLAREIAVENARRFYRI